MSKLKLYTNQWASGDIRAKQIADYLHVPCDCNEVTSEDVVVFVKTAPPEHVIKHVKRCYLDVVDCYGVIDWLRNHPNVIPIAIGNMAKEYINAQLGRNDTVLIPEHHCNFENTLVNVSKPKTVGYIGYPESFHLDVDEVAVVLKRLGLRFLYCNDFKSRQDVIDFYRTIDIQFTYRVENTDNHLCPSLKNPLKVINASSFGIPSVCYPEPSYIKEGISFISANSFDSAIKLLFKLKNDNAMYNKYSNMAIQDAKRYHISNIAKLYEGLLDD